MRRERLHLVGVLHSLLSLYFALPICAASVIVNEVLDGSEAAALWAPRPVAGDASGEHVMEAPAYSTSVREERSRPPQRNYTRMFVAGVAVSLLIFVLTYCIAYRNNIMARQTAWNEHYLFRSSRRGALFDAEQNRDGYGGLAASRVRELPIVKYSASMVKEESLRSEEGQTGMWARECAVCLSEFEEGEEMKVLPACRHCFHKACISMWLRSHTTCPLCRLSLVTPSSA